MSKEKRAGARGEIPEVIVGVDPGGTVGMVLCCGWEEDLSAWPPRKPTGIIVLMETARHAAPVNEEMMENLGRQMYPPHYLVGNILGCKAPAFGGPRYGVALEECQASSLLLKETIEQVGMFKFQVRARSAAVLATLQAPTWRSWLLQQRCKKGEVDRKVAEALLELYGGKEKAVGGKKCATCRGKGKVGRGRWRKGCQACCGKGASFPGPLHRLFKPKMKRHHIDALAIALYAGNNPEVWEWKS